MKPRPFWLLPAVFVLGAAMPGAQAFEEPRASNETEAVPPNNGTVDRDPSGADDSKTHTLFMGADIAVSLDKGLYPVRGVVGSSWVVEINGVEKIIPARQAPLTLKITPNLKLTDRSANIADYKKERAYTFNNDPSTRITRGLSQTAMSNLALMANARDAQAIADTQGNKALGAASTLAGYDNQLGAAALLTTGRSYNPGNAPAAPQGNMNYAQANAMAKTNAVDIAADQAQSLAFAQQNASADLNQTQNGNEPGGRVAPTGMDAMQVEFEISSARPLNRPYVVTMTQFHPKGSKRGTVQNLVYARELGPIDAQAR